MRFETPTDTILTRLNQEDKQDGKFYGKDCLEVFHLSVEMAEEAAPMILEEDMDTNGQMLTPGQEAQQLSVWARHVRDLRSEVPLEDEEYVLRLAAIEKGLIRAMKQAHVEAYGSSGKSRSRRGRIPGMPVLSDDGFISEIGQE